MKINLFIHVICGRWSSLPVPIKPIDKPNYMLVEWLAKCKLWLN